MTPKDHYVPKFYLESFVDPTTGKLWTVDLKTTSIREDAPKDAARISGYDNLQGNTSKDRIVASKALKAIETRAAPVIVKIRNQAFQLTFDERDTLSNFIALQIGRVPIFRDFINARMEEAYNERLRERVRSDKFESDYGEDAAMIRERVLSGKYPVRLKFKEPFDKKDGELLSSMMLGQKFSSLLFGMSWMFFVVRDGGAFFTSDNPAGLLSPNAKSLKIDFNKPDASLEISFPISPSCALLGHFHDDSQYRVVDINSQTSDELNKRVFPTIRRYIYCSKQEQAIQVLDEIRK